VKCATLKLLRKTRFSESGAAAVEFALVVPLLLFLILTMIDMGRLLIVESTVNTASYEGARVAAKSVTRNISAVQQAVWASFPISVAQLSTISQCATGNSGCVGVLYSGPNCTTLASGGAPVISATVSVTFRYVNPISLSYFFGGASWGSPVDIAATSQAVCLD
jgi:Flp pilus assembly protein TadG